MHKQLWRLVRNKTLYFINLLYKLNTPQMINFQHRSKQKSTRLVEPKVQIHQSIIKKSDAQLTDICINGIQLPHYGQLTTNKKKRHGNRYHTTSFYEESPKQTQSQMCGLFKNTAIRTKMKSLQIQTNITILHPQVISLQRRSLCQKQTPSKVDHYIKTSTFLQQKSKKKRYSNPQAVLNRTHRSFKTQKYIEQSVRCHSTKNKKQNPLWNNHNSFNDMHLKDEQKMRDTGSRLSISNGFNDILRVKRQAFLSLNRAQGSIQISSKQTFCIEDANCSKMQKSIFSQSPSQSKMRSKVCYSIKLRRQQKQLKAQAHLKSTKIVLPDYEQQETENDN